MRLSQAIKLELPGQSCQISKRSACLLQRFVRRVRYFRNSRYFSLFTMDVLEYAQASIVFCRYSHSLFPEREISLYCLLLRRPKLYLVAVLILIEKQYSRRLAPCAGQAEPHRLGYSDEYSIIKLSLHHPLKLSDTRKNNDIPRTS